MGFQTNFIAGTEVTVSGEVDVAGLPEPTTSQTPVYAYHATSSSNAETAYTVTAGKTFYLTGFFVAGSALTAAVALYETDGTTTILNGRLVANATDNVSFTPSTPIAVYSAGEFVKVKSTTSGGRFTIVGYEV